MIISVDNVSLGYDNNIVLKDISFDINRGDFICVVGPNGSGKSTLIKGILGLIKPIKGKIIYKDIKQNFIGYMPQEAKVDSNFPASVFEIVISGTLNKLGFLSFYSKKEEERAKNALKTLGISNLINNKFCDLSGGQRQKVLLARSLCATNGLLVLDEPSNNLDSNSKKELYEIVRKLNKEDGITIIMVTHDLDHDNLIGNKILSLRDEFYFGDTQSFIRRIHNDK